MKGRILKLAKKALTVASVAGKIDTKTIERQIEQIRKTHSGEKLNFLRAYRNLLRSKIASQTIVVESSIALVQKESTSIEKLLKTKFGKEKEIEFKINESILGGLRVKVGDEIIDYSIVGKLNQLKEVFA